MKKGNKEEQNKIKKKRKKYIKLISNGLIQRLRPINQKALEGIVRCSF